MTNPRNYALNKVLLAELDERTGIRDRIIAIILDRCELGAGRLRQGSLLKYVFDKVGMKGLFGKVYREYMKELLVSLGARATDHGGAAIFTGIRWKGEKPCDWKYPHSPDIPTYNKSINNWQYGQRQDRIALEERVSHLEKQVATLSLALESFCQKREPC
jgi:hypothetical protein